VVDVAVLGMVAVGLVVGLLKGFLLQFTGLAAIVGGLFLADRYHGKLRTILDGIATSEHNAAIAFVVIVLVTILVVALLSRLCQGVIRKLDLGAYDRLLGAALGALKAAVICAGILLAIVAFAADGGSIESAIGSSRAGPALWEAMDRVAGVLPEKVGQPVKQVLHQNALPPPVSPPPSKREGESTPPENAPPPTSPRAPSSG